MNNEQNKKIALDFLNMVIAGKIDEAYEKYVDMDGKHHNAYFPKGFATLREGMKENERQFPGKIFEVKNIIAENDTVATHSHLILKKNDPGIVAVHIFKIANGKIVEMWDLGQVIPADCPNTDGLF